MSKTTSVEGGEFPCGKCDRAFISRPALTMHINRVHSRKVKVPGQKQSEEERLAHKRAYNRKYRLRKGMKVRPLSLKEAQDEKNAANKGATWSPGRRARFEKARRAKDKANRNNGVSMLHDELNKEPVRDPREFINCCPNCGYNLKAHYLAAGFKTP